MKEKQYNNIVVQHKFAEMQREKLFKDANKSKGYVQSMPHGIQIDCNPASMTFGQNISPFKR